MEEEDVTTPYAEIGDALRAARDAMQITTHQAADELHIRACYLDALEEGRFDALPGAAYAKGYLQNYATYLKLDRQEIVRQFEMIESSTKQVYFLPQALRREKKPTQGAIWGGALAAVVLYGIWLLFGTSWHAALSVVDAAPQANGVRLHGVTYYPDNLACFQEPPVLYPPCHMTWAAALSRPPKKGPLTSVMDLATTLEY